MNILMFGSNGFMGRYFRGIFPDARSSRADIANWPAVAKDIDEFKPDVVINCAGRTGRPNVDWCEDHKTETLHSNVTGALVLLEACVRENIYMVHLSTGCIYSGDNGGTGFKENDPPNFFGSFYSRTKGWTDQIMRDFPVLNLRLRMPFCDEPDPRNLITKLAKYPKVLDAENSLTYIPDFLAAASKLINQHATGTYNVVNPGTISPYKVMELYREIVDDSHRFKKLTLEELPDQVKAPRSNCVLNTEKLIDEDISLMPVEEAVKTALERYSVNK